MDTAVVDSAAEGASSALAGLAHAAVLSAPTAPMASAIGAAPRARMRLMGVNFSEFLPRGNGNVVHLDNPRRARRTVTRGSHRPIDLGTVAAGGPGCPLVDWHESRSSGGAGK